MIDLNKLDYSQLKKLTIIIPSYRRQDLLSRCMQYWSGKNVNIIVLDGSEVSLEKNFLNNINSNIKYIHNPKNLYERLLLSLNYIETEYVMLGCDDEFYLQSSLNSCLNRLSQDKTLVCCMGRAMGFSFYNNTVVGHNVYHKLKNRFQDDDDPAIRLKKHFSDYTIAHMYGVTRASFWKIIAKSVFSKEYNFFAAMELQLEFLILYAGKSTVLPELMWMRSGENDGIRNTSPSLTTSFDFFTWWRSSENKKEKNDFINRIKFACHEINQLNNKRYDLDIFNLFENYFQFNRPKFYNKFYKYLPSFIRDIIKYFFKMFGHDVTKRTPLNNIIKSLIDNGIKVELSDLKKIEQTINLFYSEKK